MNDQENSTVQVRVFLLGDLYVERRRQDRTWEAVPSDSQEWGPGTHARTLLRYLLCNGRCVGRGTIMDTLWPDIDSAERYLNNSASILRRVLRWEEQGELLETVYSRTTYKLADQARLWVDRDQCEALLEEAERIGYTTVQGLALLKEAESYLSRGPFLADELGDWCLGQRENVRTMHYRCRLWLAEAYEVQQELRQAEKVIEGLLREDPTDESALCRLMHILHTQGLTAEALRRCKQVAALLARQGLSLSPETEMLAKELQSRPRIMTHAAPILGVPSSPDMNEVEVRGNLHTQEGITPVLANAQIPITDVYVSTIENLATITQQYRLLQLAGFATEDGLRSHINLIQSTLETTVNGKYRCELWRILAQSQILARHSITKKRELGRARTWNEAAIASARYSGDTLLLGTTIGHLGHLYLTWQHDPVSAGKLLEQAQEYTGGHPVNGWFAMVAAAIAAAEENHNECEASVARATEVVGGMPMTAEYTDLFYTDFNIAGTDAFAGNCLLKVGEPTKALERLTSINLEVLAENRHASTLYDIACAHAATGDLEAMQVYAFRSIDKALATNRLYILPRFVTLAQKIQAKDRHETHAAAVAEYIHTALHQ